MAKAKKTKAEKKETPVIQMPAIKDPEADIKLFNKDRDRYYGKRIGDRVSIQMQNGPLLYGTVVKYGLMDNNRVIVKWDNDNTLNDHPEVAELLTVIQTVEEIEAGAEVLKQPEWTPINNVPAEEPAPQPVVQLVAAPPVTYEVVEARFNTELTKLKYQDALQNLENYTITEDNLAEAQLKLAKARGFLTKMDKIKEAGAAPALKEWQHWNSALKSIKSPLETLLKKKGDELTKIAQAQALKAETERKETARKAEINTAIDNFIIEQSQAIAAAKDLETLVSIEKLIGSNRANTSRYQEFLPNLVERSKELTTLIATQKQTIKKLKDIEKKKAVAEKNNDDAALLELEDKKEELEQKFDETTVIVQERAVNQVTKPEYIVPSTQVFNTVSARRTTWKAELVRSETTGQLDAKELKNAFNAGLLKCEIDRSKTDIVLKTLQGTGALKDKKELIVNGIRYFEEKFY